MICKVQRLMPNCIYKCYKEMQVQANVHGPREHYNILAEMIPNNNIIIFDLFHTWLYSFFVTQTRYQISSILALTMCCKEMPVMENLHYLHQHISSKSTTQNRPNCTCHIIYTYLPVFLFPKHPLFSKIYFNTPLQHTCCQDVPVWQE